MCEHKKFDAIVSVARIEDIGKFLAEITIKCSECNTPFKFQGMSIGLDYSKTMVSFDGLEARIPIVPKDEKIETPEMTGYEVKKH